MRALLIPTVVLAGCGPATPPFTEADREAIQAQRAAFVQALQAGDATRAAAMYSEDTFVMPANARAVSGKLALKEMFAAMPPVGAVALYGERFEPAGDAVLVIGRYAMTMLPPGSDVAVADTGKYVEVWRRENGAWRLAVDIWNSDKPLPEPPPPPAPARRR